MKIKENLIFLGMMGSGKTSIGLIISQKLNRNFIDVDQEIEKSLDMKISEIFITKGEEYFRKIEEKTTLNLLKKKNNVISLGGGAFLNNNIKNEILKNHISFWLNWNPQTLVNRIYKNIKRPMTYNATKNDLIEMINKRSKVYSKALYKINCDNLSKNKIVEKILKIYETD
tara:strand:- start:710 stop:1222 length:513 start_codon:yes stop_codon:yes gene_type:complete